MAKKFVWLVLLVFIAGFVGAVTAQQKDEMVKCSCGCGMEIKKTDAKSFDYKGNTYYFCCDKCKETFAKDPEKFLKEGGCCSLNKDMVKCPVSGEVMKKSDVKVTAEYKGQLFSFCCEKCKEAFLKEPEKYLKTVYSCPKCEGVCADKPGKCPKCGADLQAKTVQKNLCGGCQMMKGMGGPMMAHSGGKGCCSMMQKSGCMGEKKETTEKK